MENKKESEDNELIDKLYEIYKDLQKKQEEKDKKKLKELLTREVTYVPSPLFPKVLYDVMYGERCLTWTETLSVADRVAGAANTLLAELRRELLHECDVMPERPY